MGKLLERGATTRRRVLESLSATTGHTEDELSARVNLSKNGVRAILRKFGDVGIVSSRRRKLTTGRPGAPPIEYLLSKTVEAGELEALLESTKAASRESAPRSEELHVVVSRGTNDYLLTRAGSILLGYSDALARLAASDPNLEILPLREFDRRFGRAMDALITTKSAGGTAPPAYPPFAPKSRRRTTR